MRVFDSEATRAAMPFERLIPALKAMFAAGCEAPPRHVHEVRSPGGGFTSLIMPAWVMSRRAMPRAGCPACTRPTCCSMPIPACRWR